MTEEREIRWDKDKAVPTNPLFTPETLVEYRVVVYGVGNEVLYDRLYFDLEDLRLLDLPAELADQGSGT